MTIMSMICRSGKVLHLRTSEHKMQVSHEGAGVRTHLLRPKQVLANKPGPRVHVTPAQLACTLLPKRKASSVSQVLRVRNALTLQG